MTINEFSELSSHTKNVLKLENVVYVSDLIQRTEDELLRNPNIGPNELAEIKAMLDVHFFSLGTQLDS